MRDMHMHIYMCMQHTRNHHTQAEIVEMREYYGAIADKYLPAALDF